VAFKGLRVLPVDNYLVFYLPDESNNIVSVIRIMYGGRDIEKHLNGEE
jgi:toxin ParE1/3/4